jgi:hypothetical protein
LRRNGRRTVCRQAGIIRTNCIDCLDRTNIAQAPSPPSLPRPLPPSSHTHRLPPRAFPPASMLPTSLWLLSLPTNVGRHSSASAVLS